MPKARIGINGFGRTGRSAVRSLLLSERSAIITHINDCNMTTEQMAYLLKFDSTYGRLPFPVTTRNNEIIITKNNSEITIHTTFDSGFVQWEHVDYVIECTGKYNSMDAASNHLGSSKKVVIGAPSKNTPMVIMGLNHSTLSKESRVISAGSCNTNCLALLCAVLNNEFGIEQALMSTVHAVTGTQSTIDGVNRKERRRGRTAYSNIVPTTTGSAKSVAKVIPELQGKIDGMAFRVPVSDGCLVDLTVQTKKSTNYNEISNKIKEYAAGKMNGFLGWTEDQIVSSDVVGNPLSCLVDLGAGIALNDNFFKLVAWTDNEFAYSSRLIELVCYINEQ